MSKENGGPAFPQFMLNVGGASGIVSSDEFGLEGMTLRDYFAAKAMQGLLSNPNVKPDVNAYSFYSWADAMIAERAK